MYHHVFVWNMVLIGWISVGAHDFVTIAAFDNGACIRVSLQSQIVVKFWAFDYNLCNFLWKCCCKAKLALDLQLYWHCTAVGLTITGTMTWFFGKPKHTQNDTSLTQHTTSWFLLLSADAKQGTTQPTMSITMLFLLLMLSLEIILRRQGLLL